LRILNVVDEFTRVCVGSHVAYSIAAAEVRRALEGMFAVHGRPQMIRSDNGREFIAATLLTWLKDEQGVTPIHIAKASPQQNGYVERFNGSMRDELLNREVFHSLAEARVVVAGWVWHYIANHPPAPPAGVGDERGDREWLPPRPVDQS
jgi:transposase InsO family protein